MQPMPSSSMSPQALPQGGADEPAAPAGYEICIVVVGDGTYRVSKEPLAHEMAEHGSAPGASGSASGEPGEGMPGEGDEAGEAGEGGESSDRIDTFEGALKAAYGIYRENPEGADSEQQMMDEYQGGM